MSTLTKNPFTNVLDEVQSAPQGQKIPKVLQGITKAMQQSSNQQVQEWGGELSSITPQLIQACQQGG